MSGGTSAAMRPNLGPRGAPTPNLAHSASARATRLHHRSLGSNSLPVHRRIPSACRSARHAPSAARRRSAWRFDSGSSKRKSRGIADERPAARSAPRLPRLHAREQRSKGEIAAGISATCARLARAAPLRGRVERRDTRVVGTPGEESAAHGIGPMERSDRRCSCTFRPRSHHTRPRWIVIVNRAAAG